MSEDRSEAIELAEVNRLANIHAETVMLCCLTWIKGGIGVPVVTAALIKAAIELQDIGGASPAQVSNQFIDLADQLREVAFRQAESRKSLN